MTRTKVFVGNLSFKTNDRDLAKEFEAAGNVASASIISRGNRSLGYGFVEMESEEEARKSVELLNKKIIDGREINVEVARPREEKPPADPNAAPANNGGGEGGRGGAGARGRRPFRGRPRRRGPRPEGGAEGAPQGGEGGAPAQPRAPRQPRQPRQPRNDADKTPRTPSQDTLFVTNLPFSVDDAGLAEIFKGLNIKSAHVVRKHNERSKGFGFVEFNNAEDQQKALQAIDKKTVDNRELVVKVALTEVPRNPAAGAAPASPAAAAPAAAASPAPAAAATTTETK
eukprot:Phypoly_transcript_13492.p1 GENE.Phypoly_transcript_13492~~Phypoly_transcript_13492.p1  ORF type:complete len:285 (+),score=66.30 Phypoly_transcript_13492:127-981(+)